MMDRAEKFSRELLNARRAFGLSEPDPQEWDSRMSIYQAGLRILELEVMAPGFAVSSVSPKLRGMLQHPLLDRPATDDDIAMLVDLVIGRESIEGHGMNGAVV